MSIFMNLKACPKLVGLLCPTVSGIGVFALCFELALAGGANLPLQITF